MKYLGVAFNLSQAGVAFQDIEVSDSPEVMTVTAKNFPMQLMEVLEEVLPRLDIEKMELYTHGDKPNIVYMDVSIKSAIINNEELVIEVSK
jgi:hypothetical protein